MMTKKFFFANSHGKRMLKTDHHFGELVGTSFSGTFSTHRPSFSATPCTRENLQQH